ncbi:MAG: peroxiredoxin [Nitrospirae bacterium YQR-1]
MEGQQAPHFELDGIDENGIEKKFTLSDFLSTGKPLVLYFYPKDNTPGCTTEACDFRDNMAAVKPKATVCAISPDNAASHRKFMNNHTLNFPILSDTDKKTLEAYGAWGEKKMYGKTAKGVIRSTFIISPDGKILKHWRAVKVKGHVAAVLQALNS